MAIAFAFAGNAAGGWCSMCSLNEDICLPQQVSKFHHICYETGVVIMASELAQAGCTRKSMARYPAMSLSW
jgi:hypothetical protein